jgi:hypothetical protein
MAPSRWAALAVARSIPDVPPRTTIRFPFRLALILRSDCKRLWTSTQLSVFLFSSIAHRRSERHPLARRRQRRLHHRHQRGASARRNDRSVSLLVGSFGRTTTILKQVVQNRHGCAACAMQAPSYFPSETHFRVASQRSWPRCMRPSSVSRRWTASLPLPTSSVTTRHASPRVFRYQV